MDNDILFDSVVSLPCSHSVNQYNGFGVCDKCRKRNCYKCLQIKDELLLCPSCFVREVSGNV